MQGGLGAVKRSQRGALNCLTGLGLKRGRDLRDALLPFAVWNPKGLVEVAIPVWVGPWGVWVRVTLVQTPLLALEPVAQQGIIKLKV